MAASIKDVMEYFGRREGQTLKDFTVEWGALSDEDKAQLKEGLGDGSLNY